MAQPDHAPRLVETERGSHRPLLPHRRCLLASQTPCSALRIHKAPLGLGSHHARALFQQLRGWKSNARSCATPSGFSRSCAAGAALDEEAQRGVEPV